MRRLVAPIMILLLLANCTGRMAIAAGGVMMVAGGIGVATGSPSSSGSDSRGCEGQSHCWDGPNLDFDVPTPGITTLLVGTGLVILGIATLKHEDEKLAAERVAELPTVAPPAPPSPPPPPPVSRDNGVWREVPPVFGDDAP